MPISGEERRDCRPAARRPSNSLTHVGQRPPNGVGSPIGADQDLCSPRPHDLGRRARRALRDKVGWNNAFGVSWTLVGER